MQGICNSRARHLLRSGLGILLCVVTLLLATAVRAQPVKVVYVDFKPYTFTNEQGEADGLLNLLTRKVLNEAGLEAEFREMPLLQMYEEINRGDLDIAFLMGAFPVWKHVMIFGREPLARLQLQVYFTDNMPPVRSSQDLRGKSALLVKGYTYGYMRDYLQFPENRVQLTLADNHREAFETLASGRNIYLLDYLRPAEETVLKMQLPGLMQRTLSQVPIYWAVSKRSPQAQGLLATLEATYQRMVWEGKLRAIE